MFQLTNFLLKLNLQQKNFYTIVKSDLKNITLMQRKMYFLSKGQNKKNTFLEKKNFKNKPGKMAKFESKTPRLFYFHKLTLVDLVLF